MICRIIGTVLLAVFFADSAVAQDAPPLVKQLNNGNWFEPAEAQALVDELYYQRAVHAYFTTLPALNVIGMRDGSEKEFGGATTYCRFGKIGWTAAVGCRLPMPT